MEQWETVGKTKKNKQNGDTKSRMSKDEKLKLMAKAPKFEELRTATDTKFSVLDIEKPKEVEVKKEKSATPVTAASPKKSEKEKPKPPKTVEEAIKQMNHRELVAHIDNVKKRFSSTPEVVLDELASYLNSRLTFEGGEASALLEKPVSYLPSQLSKETKKYLEQLIRSQENRLLEKYFSSWVKGMAQEMAKNRPVNGYKLLLSLLLADKHSLDEDQLVNVAELCEVYKNQPKIILTIFWAVGNAGRKDAKTGLNVWRLVMSNFLQFKNYSKPAVDYLTEQLAKVPEGSKKTYLTEKDYFKLFDQLYPLEGKCTLPTQTRKTLIAEMPRIRTTCYGNGLEMLRNYFIPYLERLSPIAEDSVKSEISEELVQCLRYDLVCSKVWENQFKNYLDQSVVLLDYLVEKQNSLPRFLLRTLVSRLHDECSKVIDSFHEQNRSGSRFKKHKKLPEGFQRCKEISGRLLDAYTPRPKRKKSSSLPKWYWTLLFLLFSIVFCDVNYYGLGSFEDSYMVQFYRHYGLREKWDAVYIRTSAVMAKTHRHLLEYYPAYYEPVSDAAMVAWNAGAKAVNRVSAYASDVYVWLVENISVAVDKIEETLPGTKVRVACVYSFFACSMQHGAARGLEAARLHVRIVFGIVVELLQPAIVQIQNLTDYVYSQLQKTHASWEELGADIVSALKRLVCSGHYVP